MSVTPDPALLTRLQASAEGVQWAARLVEQRQHERLGDEWTANQHLFHLIANEEVFQRRIAEATSAERPAFEKWDSLDHMERNYVPGAGMDRLAAEFVTARAQTIQLFGALQPEDWSRRAVWPDGRDVDIAWIAEKVLWHALDHYAFLLDLHGEFEPLQARG